MPTTIKKTIRYSLIIWITLIIVGVLPIALFGAEMSAAATTEPTPWWQRVDEIQSLILKWIAAVTAIVGALAVLAAFVIAKLTELRHRMDRHDAREIANATKPPDQVDVTITQKTEGK